VLGEGDFATWRVAVGGRDAASGAVIRRVAAVVYNEKYARTQSYDILDADTGEVVDEIVGDVRDGENDFDSDIALLFLDRAVTTVSPAKLPKSAHYLPVPGWRVYGWGVTGDTEDVNPDGLLTAAQLDATAVVAEQLGDPLRRVYAAYMTVSGTVSGTCYGDSGGPLVDGRGVVIGLTSSSFAERCADPIPTLFTKMSSFLSWKVRAEHLARVALRSARADVPVIALP
jgi:hypothetical protein